MSDPIAILSTATVGTGIVDEAKANGIDLDVTSFIDVQHIENADLAYKISALAVQPLVVVFTSKHSVLAVAELLKTKGTKWTIYCLGGKTKLVVDQYFKENQVLCEHGDATTLATRLVADSINEVVFFCGDRRLNNLPNVLKGAGVQMKEFVVYHTIETPRKVDKSYEAVLFFSPSGVSSFFSANTVPPDAVLFAIGHTTAGVIKAYAQNKIVISNTLAKEHVVQDAIKYFKTI